jgi:hypothetical protein
MGTHTLPDEPECDFAGSIEDEVQEYQRILGDEMEWARSTYCTNWAAKGRRLCER